MRGGGGGGGGGCMPTPVYLYLPSRTKLQCMLQLRGQIQSPYFISIPMYSLVWQMYFFHSHFKSSLPDFNTCSETMTASNFVFTCTPTFVLNRHYNYLQYAPMIYTAPCVMVLMRADTYGSRRGEARGPSWRGRIKGGRGGGA